MSAPTRPQVRSERTTTPTGKASGGRGPAPRRPASSKRRGAGRSSAGVSVSTVAASARLVALRGLALVPTRSVAGIARSAGVRGIVIAALAAIAGYLCGLVPVLIVWMSAPTSGLTWSSTLRVGGLAWLTGQGAPISIGDTAYSLTPWGLAVVPLLILITAARGACRRVMTIRGRAWLVLSTTIAYTVILTGASVLVAVPGASVAPVGAALIGAITAALVTAAVALGPVGWALLPTAIRIALRAAGIALAALLAAGAVVVAVSLAFHMDTAVAMQQALAMGAFGAIGVALVGLVYVPVIVVWGAAYLVGAGVVLGPQVVASPFLATVAPTTLPPLPLLAAIPSSVTPVAWALPLLAVAAGVPAGLLIARRTEKAAWWMPLALAALAAAVVGVAMIVLSVLAGGALGNVRLAHVGPAPLLTGGLTFVLVCLGAVPSALAGGRIRDPRAALSVVAPVVIAETVSVAESVVAESVVEPVAEQIVKPVVEPVAAFDPDATAELPIIAMSPAAAPSPESSTPPVADSTE